MQKLWKNTGGYFGEVIDIDAVLTDVRAIATAKQWQVEQLPVREGLYFWTLQRNTSAPRKRLYISTGIHGDEPAGPLAVLQLLRDATWPDDVGVWLCPCLNPTGFPLNRRENADGVDLNRDYLHLQSDETRAHIQWLESLPSFDAAFCLHEDWESHGFYLYELNPDHQPSFSQSIIDRVTPVCPIDLSPEIEGRAAQGGIINPNLDPHSRPQWPEAFYLITHKTRLSYTLEAPSDFRLPTRVAALVEAMKLVLEKI